MDLHQGDAVTRNLREIGAMSLEEFFAVSASWDVEDTQSERAESGTSLIPKVDSEVVSTNQEIAALPAKTSSSAHPSTRKDQPDDADGEVKQEPEEESEDSGQESWVKALETKFKSVCGPQDTMRWQLYGNPKQKRGESVNQLAG
jgi:hypothetical protein